MTSKSPSRSGLSPPASLPTRFDFREAESRLYQMWEDGEYFHSEPDAGREPFAIVIPPPNVTGALHLGHALNNMLQDVLIRFRRMQGYSTLWMPGTDHAGIATQAVVEKRLREEEGKSRHDLGREELVDRIWRWKDAYERRIISQLKQMGCSCDWQRTRFTLDDVCALAVRQTFFDLFRKQLIYRGKRLVNWDTFLQTAVSDDEVFHETVAGHFWHFRYPVIDPRPGEPTHVTIATTRPETMLGDTAVAVHPDPGSALERLEHELEKKLSDAPARDQAALQAELENVRKRRGKKLGELRKLRDMAREGRRLMLPLLNREIPLIADPWAKPELGSGCVKITPAHDPNDYEVGLRCRLPMVNILKTDGTLNANAGPYAGLTVSQARKQVVTDLEQLGLLEETEDREIDLAHSDRSKTPIEPYLADQWFVKMAGLAQSAMDAVSDGRVKIVPARYGKGYLDWLSEKRDWPVSRQLWWGHRIPVWSLTAAKSPQAWSQRQLPHIAGADLGTVPQAPQAAYAETTASCLFDGPGEDEVTLCTCVAPGHEAIEKELEQAGMRQEEDVLDTWFSSALWPHSTLGWPARTADLAYYYPTSTLITSRDIITLWVARMVIMGLNNMADVPFHEVFIHPKILDGYGETMSKSKGNGVDPVDVIEKFGADALRFGLALLCTETQDARMPVQFECPHCATLLEQTRENRELPRIVCSKCGRPFSTQWASNPEDRSLARGAVVSERFELARNFCNKLWNVSRLVLMKMDGYTSAPVLDQDFAFEDRWILSRLASVTQEVTAAFDSYRYAEAARTLCDFAWNEFCSFYAEMLKERLEQTATRPGAQRVAAHVLDQLLRLLHPLIPFLTEEIWQLLGRATDMRGLPQPDLAAESIVIAPWPEIDVARQDARLESQFAEFQAVLGAIREIRSSQQIPPRQQIEFSVRCDDATVTLLEPMRPFFRTMAGASDIAWGPEVMPPPTHAQRDLGAMEVFVDLKDVIDVEAEIVRNNRQVEKLQKMIIGKRQKLANENFIARAPASVVQGERDSLAQLQEQLASAEAILDQLKDR